KEKPDNPITPSITSATPLPTPGAGTTPTPAPTPTPTPNPSSKTLARPAQSWVQTGTGDFLSGDFQQTFATNEGLIRLAPTTKLLATTSEPFGWSITSDGHGNTYLGTGSKARIIRINANGEQSVFYEGPEVAVTALTTDPAGNVYAGVTPAGRVYKFSPDGQRTTLFDSGQTFIWALEWDASGHLLIGTGGDTGKIYHQTDAGIKELAHLPQKHVRAISVRGNDLYVGAGDEGVLYRVDATTGNATALYQASEGTGKAIVDTEILSVAAAPDGVYFGTSGVGTIYRWTSEAGVIPLYASPQQSVYALRYVGKDAASGRLYAATGDQGIVYQIQPGHDANDTRVARILEPTQLQALSLAVEPDSGHLLVGTGNNAAAFRVALQDTTTGSFTSSVFDAKNIVQWGALRMIGQGAAVETRTGNTVDPDPSWSTWKPVSANEIGELQVTSPAARYLQYRVHLSGSNVGSSAATTPDQGPNVSRVEVIYRTKNSPPSVGLISPHGGEYWSGKKKVNWIGKDPDNDPLRYHLWISGDDGKTWQAVDLDDATSTSTDIDTTKWHDGTYRLKVDASDAARNPEDPQRDESISLPIIIDNTAPKIASANLVRSPNANDAVRLEAVATDALSPIAGAEWRFVSDEKTDPAKTTTSDTTKPTAASTPALAGTSASKKTDGPDAKSSEKAKPTATEPKTTTVDSTKTLTDASSTDTAKDTKKDKDDEWQAVAATDGIF
ncbi:MAG: hypothetical protein JOZ57_11260, partial [Abitibacteriaceae bacterium]|nr:hypothetical protein [Abditibacteriaceae bacterium]